MTEMLSAGTEVINWHKFFSSAVRNSSLCEERNSKCLPAASETSWLFFEFELLDTALKPSNSVTVKIQ
jgi:hypothetical protein